MKIRVLFFLSILVCSSASVLGQEISEKLCDEVFDLVEQYAKPEKTYRRETYKSDCVFEFIIVDKTQVFVSIEKYNTKRASHKNLKSDLSSFLAFNNLSEEPKFSRLKLNPGKHWNEVYFYKSNFRDNFALLRRNNFNVVMISTDHKILIDLEKLVRSNKFEN